MNVACLYKIRQKKKSPLITNDYDDHESCTKLDPIDAVSHSIGSVINILLITSYILWTLRLPV